MATRHAWTVGEVFAFPCEDGGWSACQVVRADEWINVVALDHCSDAPPTLGNVRRIPLRQRSFGANGKLCHISVHGELPADFVRLGWADAVVPPDPRSHLHAGLDSLPIMVMAEREWAQLHAAVRDAYDPASELDPVVLRGEGATLRLRRRESCVHLDLTGRAAAPNALAPKDPARFDPAVLDALPCLTELRVTGAAPWLHAWLADHPLLRGVSWAHPGVTALDLRASHLTWLELTDPDLRAATLPDTLCLLQLRARSAAPLDLTAKDHGSDLALELWTWDTDGLRAVRGINAAQALQVRRFATLDLAAVAPYTRCKELLLSGAPGRLRGAASLSALSALQRLQLRGCVALDAAEMPALSAWANLDAVHARGCHARDVAALKARWGRDRRVHLSASIDDDEVFATADHPVLRWPDGTRRGVVTRAYTLAAKKLCQRPLTAAVAQKALASFVTGVRRAVQATGALTDGERADLAGSWARLVARASAQDLDLRGVRAPW